jgi:hypothetical protein
MEEQTQKRLDQILEDELARGYRIKALPPSVRKQLDTECGAAISRVRFTRLNPSRRRKIAQVVQRQYHKDLQNPEILSHEQILKLVGERGEWSKALDDEMDKLREKTNREMGELFLDGIIRDSWTADLLEAAATFRERVREKVAAEDVDGVLTRFDRWLEYAPDRRDEWTQLYAADQGRETYSPDFDLQRLLEKAPDLESVDALNLIDELSSNVARYVSLQRDRVRLAELQLKHVKIFSESVEQRRDNTEEMARLYFTCEVLDENDKPAGLLAKDFDLLYDFPESAIQWLLVEAYFYLNGIPDEAREYLQRYGFLAAEEPMEEEATSTPGESEPSAESPALQSSSPESKVLEATDYASSV